MVSLSRQQCWVFRGDQMVHEWTCSTGYGEWTTRTGTFAIKTMEELAKSSAHRLDMPYWLGIYDVGAYENGIHGLPTRWSDGQKIWTGLIGQPATYGCAMLGDQDAAQLFELSFLGMPVHVVN
jgi:lipoprotein-anchoring transpeptidase ErfK/SrfK